MRTVGDDHEPRRFSTWAFKAIAGIGKRASTIEDRSIVITLKRKLAGGKVERLRHAPARLFQALNGKLSRFATDNMASVAKARPKLPEALNDRAQDNWESLLAIAEVAGGRWPEHARKAALAACGAEEELDYKTQLLADIRDAFAKKDRISSDALVAYLVGLEERPWAEVSHGKPLSKNQLALRLKPFGLKPKSIRTEDGTPKGYMREDFEATFARYLPQKPNSHSHGFFDDDARASHSRGFQTATPVQMNDFDWLRGNQTATSFSDVAVLKSRNLSIINDVADVAVWKGGNRVLRDVSVSGAENGGGEAAAEPNPDEPEERKAMAAGTAPNLYLDAWATLQVQRPHGVTEASWRQAIDDGGPVPRQMGNPCQRLALAAWCNLRCAERQHNPGGLAWRLDGCSVIHLIDEIAIMNDYRAFDRTTGKVS